MKNKKITVLIADDHVIFREGLKMILEPVNQLEITGEASNGRELISRVQQTSPDIILTDIKMPFLNGVEATRKLRDLFPSAKIIALSMYSDEQLVVDMLDAGAQGFLLKNAICEEVVTAIETVHADKPYFSQEITERLAKIIVERQIHVKESTHVGLTELEKQIVRLICKEQTSKQIAEKLKVSKRTIESYRIRIMDKIGAKSVAGIITYAFQSDMLQSTTGK